MVAVGYARRSTDMQDRSIPDQKAYVETWAKENGYTIARWYVDDAISGTSTRGRDEFEQMIADAEAGSDFATVLCYDISRFSRGGTNETGYYLHRLRLADVNAIFVAEGIPEGDEGELLQGVKSWQARQYSVKLSRDCIRGTISYILEKKSAPGGCPPFGYDKQHRTASGQVLRTFRWLTDGRKQEFGPDGKLVRVLETNETVKKAKSDIVVFVLSTPERVAVVRRIFEQCVEGYGYAHIAYRLNDDGIPNSSGGKWCSSEIKRMLENPTYRGAIAWNRRTMGKINGVGRDGKLRAKRTGNGATRHNPEADWYVVDGVHEPLVSPEMFAKARAAVASRRFAGGLAKTVNRSLLSGLLVCKHCGKRLMQAFVNYKTSQRFRYYVDNGYRRGGRSVCVCTNIPADALDAWVLEKINAAFLGDGNAAAVVDTFVKRILTRRRTTVETTGVARDLDAVNRKIKATIAMLADPAFDGLDELRTTLADLKARRDSLQATLSKQLPTNPIVTERHLRDWATVNLGDLSEICRHPVASVKSRRVLRTFVNRIEIDPHARRGTLYIPADTDAAFTQENDTRKTITRAAHGDPRSCVRSKGEA
jgi:DNA invertase Pin-like site-specific DNA recombinase